MSHKFVNFLKYRVSVVPGLAVVGLLRLCGLKFRIYPTLFGHQAIEMDFAMRRAERDGRSTLPIYIQGWVVPNQFLLKKHKEKMTVLRVPRLLLRYIHLCNVMDQRMYKWKAFHREEHDELFVSPDLWNKHAPQIEFTEAEHARGRRLLREMGLEPGRYVCFHTRESAYAVAYLPKLMVARGSRRFRAADAEKPDALVERSEQRLFQRYRHSDPERYKAALDYLWQHGIKGVRMGAVTGGKLGFAGEHIVDYAAEHRPNMGDDADFADVYLMAQSKFFLGTATGVSSIAHALNRPMVLANAFPWPWNNFPLLYSSVYMPKLVFSRKLGRLLTFEELLEFSRRHNWRKLYDDQFIEEHGLEVVDNTEEELLEAVAELNETLDGNGNETPQVRAARDELMSLFEAHPPVLGLPRRMSGGFLLRHAALLPGAAREDARRSHETETVKRTV